MNRHTLAAWRNLAAWLGAACLFLMLASLIDGSQAGGRKDPGLSEMLPGQSLKISGPMPRDAEKLDQLLLRSDTPELGLRLEETYSGFWMGGQLWRAEVTVPAAMASGDYVVSLSARNETSPKFTQNFTMRVYPSQLAMDQASLSLTMRTIGTSPFVLAAVLLPLGIAFGAVSTLLSRRLAAALRSEGLGQVVRVHKTETGLVASFTLGTRDGLSEGGVVEFLQPNGKAALFTAAISTLRTDDADIIIPPGTKPPLNALVRKIS